jgi:hypothetical protein
MTVFARMKRQSGDGFAFVCISDSGRVVAGHAGPSWR